MHHALSAIRPHLHASFARTREPVLTIRSGDTISFQTPDVSWGLEPPTSTTAPRKKVEPRDPVKDRGPCLCGPVAIEGAEPGDTLEIEILEVRPATWGWTYAGEGMVNADYNRALGIADEPLTLVRWSIDHSLEVVRSDDGFEVPLRPFPGMIGLAPAGVQADPWIPCATGGNMDCRELIAGATLFLPVMVSGGLLSVGDGHAAQGDGELSGTAIECMMDEVRVRVTVRKDLQIRTPRIRVSGCWISLGFASTLDAASALAAADMVEIMAGQLGIERARALALASSMVDMRITQMVNPHKGVHAVWTERE